MALVEESDVADVRAEVEIAVEDALLEPIEAATASALLASFSATRHARPDEPTLSAASAALVGLVVNAEGQEVVGASVVLLLVVLEALIRLIAAVPERSWRATDLAFFCS